MTAKMTVAFTAWILPKRKNNIWKRQNNKVKAPAGALIFYDIEFSFLPLRIKDFFRLIDFHFLKFPTQPAFGFLYLPQVFMINDAIFNQQDGKSLFALAAKRSGCRQFQSEPKKHPAANEYPWFGAVIKNRSYSMFIFCRLRRN